MNPHLEQLAGSSPAVTFTVQVATKACAWLFLKISGILPSSLSLCCHFFIWALAKPVRWDLQQRFPVGLLHHARVVFRAVYGNMPFFTQVLKCIGFSIEFKPYSTVHHSLSLTCVCLSTDDFFPIFIFDESSDYLSFKKTTFVSQIVQIFPCHSVS